MRRIELTSAGPSFIGAWHLDAPELCQGIIDFFEGHPSRQKAGRINKGVDLAAKHSLDLPIDPRDLSRPDHAVLAAYIGQLHACYLDYTRQWPFLGNILPDTDIGVFNIQKYGPGGHFARVHSERTTLSSAHRVLAWMTYLNDVDDGGETHFPHYGLDIRPERGKTLIWPAEWTHAHAGKVVTSGAKYIITGWMHFPPAARTQETTT